MKSKLSNASRVERELETNLPTPVNLPEAVLQIDQNNLPKFSFDLPASKPASSTPKTSTLNLTPIKNVDSQTQCLAPEKRSGKGNPFKFSSPVRLPKEQDQSLTTPPKFSFGSPERSLEKTKIKKRKNEVFVVGIKQIKRDVMPSNSEASQCDCGEYNNSNRCAYCIGNQPLKFKDIPKIFIPKLIYSETNEGGVNDHNNAITDHREKPPSKWNCLDCWVDNLENEDACVCCGASNPNKSNSKVSVPSNDISTQKKGDNFNGTSRLGGESSSAVMGGFFNAQRPDYSFKIANPKQSDKWECPSCLVRNENDKINCVCCDHEKPGTTREPQVKSFNFGVVPAFKFGITVENDIKDKPAEIKAVRDFNMLQESETNNNVLPKTSSFTFGLQTQKPGDPPNTETNMAGTTPNLNFSFGVPQLTSAAAPPAASIIDSHNKMLGSVSKSVDEDDERPQEVPKITFSELQKPEPLKPVTNLFLSPLTNTEDKLSTVPCIISSSKSGGKNEMRSDPLSATAVDDTAPKPSFTLSLKPTSSLFAAPDVTNATTSISFPLQPPPYTATSSSLTPSSLNTAPTTASTPLFQQAAGLIDTPTTLFSNNNANSTVGSTFQNSATIATVTPSTFAPSLFSRGDQQATPFSMTFGNNNKTNSENRFSPGIGSIAGTSNGLTNASLVAGHSSSPANSLGNGDRLSMSSPLGSNIMSSGNNLTPNSLKSSEDPSNSVPGGNGLQEGSGNIFGSVHSVQKENIWAINTNNNMFVSNTVTLLPLPAAPIFTFGATYPQTFESNARETPLFGMPNQNANSPIFGSTAQSQPVGVFGASTPATNPAPSLGMFGTASPSLGANSTFGAPAASVGTAPSFGVSNQSIPFLEAPSLTSGPTAPFTFGASQQRTSTFNFGQVSEVYKHFI